VPENTKNFQPIKKRMFAYIRPRPHSWEIGLTVCERISKYASTHSFNIAQKNELNGTPTA